MGQNHWNTSVTKIEPNSVQVRGHDIAQLMGNSTVGSAVYLILRGTLPSEEVGELMEAMLVSSIDHGATPPSVLAARTVASTGAGLSAAVAAGIMSINRHHGGAIENCARQLGVIIERSSDQGGSLEDAASAQLDEWKAEGIRMSGFGHRVHTNDPRTERLFELAKGADAVGAHCKAARAVESVFQSKGKPLPINVDGAMGAILADLGFDPLLMNGLFMIARVPGLVAHVYEEQTKMRPMRRIDPVDHGYDGPTH